MSDDEDRPTASQQKVFRKRKAVHNKRKQTTEESDDSSNEAFDTKIEKVKFIQSLRLKKIDSRRDSKSIKPKLDDLGGLSEHFSGKVDYGLQSKIEHEQILNQYIDEKLGVTKELEIRELSDKDKLYVIPEELKVATGDSGAYKNNLETISAIGLAEVRLPVSYRQKNRYEIEREAAMNLLKPDKVLGKSSGYSRYQLDSVLENRLAMDSDTERELRKDKTIRNSKQKYDYDRDEVEAFKKKQKSLGININE